MLNPISHKPLAPVNDGRCVIVPLQVIDDIVQTVNDIVQTVNTQQEQLNQISEKVQENTVYLGNIAKITEVMYNET